MAFPVEEGGRVVHEIVVWAEPDPGIPTFQVKITGAKNDDARVTAALHFNHDTCITLRSIRYADLEDQMLPLQQLSWGWVPPHIAGSHVIGLLHNVEITIRIENKQRSMTTCMWVFDSFPQPVDFLLGVNAQRKLATQLNMFEEDGASRVTLH